MINNKRSDTKRQIPAFELSLRKISAEKPEGMFIVWFTGVVGVKYRFSITILILIRVF